MAFSGFDDLNPDLSSALQRMIAGGAAAGHTIGVNSGYRTPEEQAAIISRNWGKFDLNPSDRQQWEADVRQYGAVEAGERWASRFSAARRTASDGVGTPMRNWIALPGSSNHQRGTAADLSYGNSEARTWAHSNAGTYGIHFPLGNEPWHAELVSARWNAETAQHDHGAYQPTTAPEGASPNAAASAALTADASVGPVAGPPETSTPPTEREVSPSVQSVANTDQLAQTTQMASQFLQNMPAQTQMAERAMYDRALLGGEARTFNDWFAQTRFQMYVAGAQAGDPSIVNNLTPQQTAVLDHIQRAANQGPQQPNQYAGRLFAQALMGV